MTRLGFGSVVLLVQLCAVAANAEPVLIRQLSVAHAEPVIITGGRSVYSQADAATISWTGASLSVFLLLGTHQESWLPPAGCFTCVPGSLITPGGAETFDPSVGSNGHFVLGAEPFYQVLAGHWTYQGPSVVVPEPVNFGMPEEPRYRTIIQGAPFTFSGEITGATDTGVQRTIELSGQGEWS